MNTININGKDYTVEALTKILDEAKRSPMHAVYEYHKTTEEEFENTYKNLPLRVKYNEKENLIVAFYNKGWKPDLKDSNQNKYYGWFYWDEFRFADCCYNYGYSSVPVSHLLQKAEYVADMAKNFLKELKDSRCTL